MRFVGDIHGRHVMLTNAISSVPESVQIGDFGMGFDSAGAASYVDWLLDALPGSHRFIRGNHDDPAECAKSKHWIPDGTVEGPVMYVGGASSIDRPFRTEGVDWWPEEELSHEELVGISDLYVQAQPRVLVTHDCPQWFAERVMIPLVGGAVDRSRTRDAIDLMYFRHRPQVHIFGHWHRNVNLIDEETGVRMICLGIGSYIDIDLDSPDVKNADLTIISRNR